MLLMWSNPVVLGTLMLFPPLSGPGPGFRLNCEHGDKSGTPHREDVERVAGSGMWRTVLLLVAVPPVRSFTSSPGYRGKCWRSPRSASVKTRALLVTGDEHQILSDMLHQLVAAADTISDGMDVPRSSDALGDVLQSGAGALSGVQDALKGLFNSLPSLPAGESVVPPEARQALDQVKLAIPQASESVQGLLQKFRTAASSVEAGEMSTTVKGQLSELTEQLKSGLDQVRGQVGGEVGGKLKEFEGTVGEELKEALKPYQPYIDETVTDLSSKLAEVQKVTGELAEQAKKEQEILLQNISPGLRVALRYATPRNVFNAENLASLPVWAGVILAPSNSLVKSFWSSYTPILLAVLAYMWLTYLAFQDPVSLQGFSSITDLRALSKGFTSETSTAVAWAHFIAQDLFVGRWIYLDGHRNNVWTSHSLALAFFFGPTGIASHLLTRGFVRIFRWDVQDILDLNASKTVPSAAEAKAQSLLTEAEKKLKDAERMADAKSKNLTRQAEDELQKAKAQGDKIVRKARSDGERLVKQARQEADALRAQLQQQQAAASAESTQSQRRAAQEAAAARVAQAEDSEETVDT